MTTPREIAIVAGGTGVLGAAVCRELDSHGFRTVVFDRTPPRLGNEDFYDVDLTNAESLDAAVGDVAAQGRIGALVGCQGWSPKVDIDSMPSHVFLQVVDVNLVSAFLLMRAVTPHMAAAGGGRIVTIASAASRTGKTVASPAYSASKAGVEALTRQWAVAHARDGVLVCGVAPGKFENPDWGDSAEALCRYVAEIPLQRLANPSEVARLVCFLASSANTYITGQTIVIDGGRLA